MIWLVAMAKGRSYAWALFWVGWIVVSCIAGPVAASK